jgi:hypothetical protein
MLHVTYSVTGLLHTKSASYDTECVVWFPVTLCHWVCSLVSCDAVSLGV